MSLRYWLFMMKLKTQADDYKYKMRLDGISEEDAYLNLDKRNVALKFIAGKFNTTKRILTNFMRQARKLGVIE